MSKRVFIRTTILIILGFIILKYGNKIYKYYNYNSVFDYGKSLTIYEVLNNDNIDLGEYSYLEEYTYKKAKVRNVGSTANINIVLNKNVIVFIGNRNLVTINGTLYVYK